MILVMTLRPQAPQASPKLAPSLSLSSPRSLEQPEPEPASSGSFFDFSAAPEGIESLTFSDSEFLESADSSSDGHPGDASPDHSVSSQSSQSHSQPPVNPMVSEVVEHHSTFDFSYVPPMDSATSPSSFSVDAAFSPSDFTHAYSQSFNDSAPPPIGDFSSFSLPPTSTSVPFVAPTVPIPPPSSSSFLGFIDEGSSCGVDAEERVSEDSSSFSFPAAPENSPFPFHSPTTTVSSPECSDHDEDRKEGEDDDEEVPPCIIDFSSLPSTPVTLPPLLSSFTPLDRWRSETTSGGTNPLSPSFAFPKFQETRRKSNWFSPFTFEWLGTSISYDRNYPLPYQRDGEIVDTGIRIDSGRRGSIRMEQIMDRRGHEVVLYHNASKDGELGCFEIEREMEDFLSMKSHIEEVDEERDIRNTMSYFLVKTEILLECEIVIRDDAVIVNVLFDENGEDTVPFVLLMETPGCDLDHMRQMKALRMAQGGCKEYTVLRINDLDHLKSGTVGNLKSVMARLHCVGPIPGTTSVFFLPAFMLLIKGNQVIFDFSTVTHLPDDFTIGFDLWGPELFQVERMLSQQKNAERRTARRIGQIEMFESTNVSYTRLSFSGVAARVCVWMAFGIPFRLTLDSNIRMQRLVFLVPRHRYTYFNLLMKLNRPEIAALSWSPVESVPSVVMLDRSDRKYYAKKLSKVLMVRGRCISVDHPLFRAYRVLSLCKSLLNESVNDQDRYGFVLALYWTHVNEHLSLTDAKQDELLSLRLSEVKGLYDVLTDARNDPDSFLSLLPLDMIEHEILSYLSVFDAFMIFHPFHHMHTCVEEGIEILSLSKLSFSLSLSQNRNAVEYFEWLCQNLLHDGSNDSDERRHCILGLCQLLHDFSLSSTFHLRLSESMMKDLIKVYRLVCLFQCEVSEEETFVHCPSFALVDLKELLCSMLSRLVVVHSSDSLPLATEAIALVVGSINEGVRLQRLASSVRPITKVNLPSLNSLFWRTMMSCFPSCPKLCILFDQFIISSTLPAYVSEEDSSQVLAGVGSFPDIVYLQALFLAAVASLDLPILVKLFRPWVKTSWFMKTLVAIGISHDEDNSKIIEFVYALISTLSLSIQDLRTRRSLLVSVVSKFSDRELFDSPKFCNSLVASLVPIPLPLLPFFARGASFLISEISISLEADDLGRMFEKLDSLRTLLKCRQTEEFHVRFDAREMRFITDEPVFRPLVAAVSSLPLLVHPDAHYSLIDTISCTRNVALRHIASNAVFAEFSMMLYAAADENLIGIVRDLWNEDVVVVEEDPSTWSVGDTEFRSSLEAMKFIFCLDLCWKKEHSDEAEENHDDEKRSKTSCFDDDDEIAIDWTCEELIRSFPKHYDLVNEVARTERTLGYPGALDLSQVPWSNLLRI